MFSAAGLFKNLKDLPLIPVFLIIAFLVILFFNSFVTIQEEQFSLLAKSFLKGKLFFTEQPASGWNDTIFFNGQHYWQGGLFPALILMPIVAVGNLFYPRFDLYQTVIQPVIVISLSLLVFKLVERVGFSKVNSLWLVVAFIYSSPVIGLIAKPWSMYFAQLLTAVMTTGCILEYLLRKRYWLIGIMIGLTLLTRLTAGLIFIFFVLDIIFSSEKKKIKIKKMAEIIIPIIVALVVLGFYNNLRFSSPFESGYTSPNLLIREGPLFKSRQAGVFSLSHVPTNIYYSILNMPKPVFKNDGSFILRYPFIKPDNIGMSFFFLSPWLFYFLFLKNNDKVSKLVWITIAVVVVPIYLYYSTGFLQFGWRFAVDFLPLLFFLFARNFYKSKKVLSNGFKALLIVSILVNLHLVVQY